MAPARTAGLFALGAAMSACAIKDAPHAGATEPSPIQRVSSWGYQLQAREGARLDLGALSRCPFDLLVIDLGDGDRPLTATDVARLKTKPDRSRRLVLAYLSIGEAEEYRSYFEASWKTKPPAFLAKLNKDWKGNYKVRFWDPAWQRLVFEYLDRIVASGFDGAYLDIIDAFDYFGPDGEMPERPTAAKDMQNFVLAIARHARKEHADFLVVPQNGAEILDALSPTDGKAYLDAIDAIGAEDTFFEDDKRKRGKEVVASLERFKNAGRPVLAVDYVSDPARAKRFTELAKKHGFIPYVGTRELDRLMPQP
jgi:cysteinyl-tRNA synthetase